MATIETIPLFSGAYNARRGLIDMEDFLGAIGLQDQYKEAFVANFGGTPKLETLRKRLDCRALLKMGIQDFSHQKRIMNHLRSIPNKPASPIVVSSVLDDPAVSALLDGPCHSLPPLPAAAGVLENEDDAYTSPHPTRVVKVEEAGESVQVETAEESAATSWSGGEENGGCSEEDEALPPVLERLGSGTTPITHEDEVLLQRLERCASGLAGVGTGGRSGGGEQGAARQRGMPIRSVFNRDKDTEKLMRSNWTHIAHMQKEVDEHVRSKRHNTIERIRSGQLAREDESVSRSTVSQGAPSSNHRAGGGSGAGHQPPQPPSEVGRRSSSAQLSTSGSDVSLDKVKDTQLRSLNYGNCALRMGLIEKHLLSVQNRIVEEVRRVIGCERASLMFVDTLNGLLFFFVNDKPIRIPSDQGIAGLTAQTGEVLLVDNAYNDARFHPQVDRETGFRTQNILSFPVRQRHGGRVIAVIQMLNKQDGFDPEDVAAVESCSLEVADELEACTETLATATAQWDKFRINTAPRVSLTQRQSMTSPEQFAHPSMEGHIRRFGSMVPRPLNEWNAGWTEKARVEESIRLKRRTEYGRHIVKSQYGL